MSETEYETVHTVTDYWDGPRGGIADYNGKPYLYQSNFDDTADEWSDTFLLRSVDASVFAMALEDWEIWLRWERAFHEGRTTIETHPALPEDRQRHTELKTELDKHLTVDLTTAEVIARAKFRAMNDYDVQRPGFNQPLLVSWIPVPFDSRSEIKSEM